MTPQQYCLRWKHHHSNVQSMFAQLLEKERFCDVTLYCSPNFTSHVNTDVEALRGVSLRAHRVVLAACSELLGSLLGAHEAQGEPVLVIDGAEPKHMRALLDYMYTGEMNVHHSQLAGLLKTAEELRIKGLTDIRWNNKDEPPDCASGAITTTQMRPNETKPDKTDVRSVPELRSIPEKVPEKIPEVKTSPIKNEICEDNEEDVKEKFTLNGGPPPLIKLPVKHSPLKRDHSDTESQSPKRQRLTSATEHTDEDSSHTIKMEKVQEWRHGNLNISVEKIVGWGATDEQADWSRDASDDEWADAPADIGSFLHTKLKVDGDNSADEESDDSAAVVETRAHASSSSSTTSTSHLDVPKPTKSGVTDPRFADVIKLNDYLRHGRRPQFWEEHYVKRVMDAVRVKELEMKQAAEILGVSYGTLYGRYRDVYGCINRPYSTIRYNDPKSKGDSGGGQVDNDPTRTHPILRMTARDFWQAKGPSEVLDRLQRGDINLDAAALALGVNPTKLAAYIADGSPCEERILPLQTVPSYVAESLCKKKEGSDGTEHDTSSDKSKPRSYAKKEAKKSHTEEDCTVSPYDPQFGSIQHAPSPWPAIRVANIESLRATDKTPSPSQLMKTRPDLTIIAAKRDKDET